MSFEYQLIHTEHFAHLIVSGKIMSEDKMQHLMQEVEMLFEKKCNSIIVDIASLDYCNSTGLNLFVRLLTKTRAKGGNCVLVGLKGSVEKLFELSKLNQIFTCVNSLDEAKALI